VTVVGTRDSASDVAELRNDAPEDASLSGDSGAGVTAAPADSTSTSSAIASGTKALAIAQVVNQGTRLLTSVVLARLLTPRDFGLVAIALIVGMFLEEIKDLGTGSAVIQRKTVSSQLLNAIFYLNVGVGAGLALALFASSGYVAGLLGSAPAPAASVLRWFAVVTFVSSLGQIHHATLRRDLRFRVIAWINIAGALSTAIVSIAGAVGGMGVWALVAGYLIGSVVDTSLVWIYDRWRPRFGVNLAALRSIWSYSSHLFLVNVMQFFFLQSDRILVGRYLGVTSLGLYSMAQRVLAYPTTSIANVANEVAFPAFARKQDDDHALQRGFIRLGRVVALVTFPLMAIAAAAARPMVDTILGPKWSGLVPLIWILAPVGAIQTVTFNAAGLLMAKGRTDMLLRWTFVSSALIIASYVCGLPFGLVGMCVSYAIAIMIVTPCYLLLGFRLIGMRLRTYVRQLLPIATMAAASAGAVLGLEFTLAGAVPEFVVLVVAVLGGLLVYCLIVIWTGTPAWEDTRAVLRSRGGSLTALSLGAPQALLRWKHPRWRSRSRSSYTPRHRPE
jgi:lipopolysaccharide exporter